MKNNKGRPKTVEDQKLKEIALQIKTKHKGQKLSFLMLEKETGISRNTWRRRISDYIQELNTPIMQSTEQADVDIYFPDIEEIFSSNNNSKEKIAQELHAIIETLRSLYLENKELKRNAKDISKLETTVQKQKFQLDKLKHQVLHYENLYKTLVVSSAFPHLREEKAIQSNLLDFNKDIYTNANVEQQHLKKTFADPRSEVQKEDKLKEMFPNLFT
ncbi:hypothetical protein [Paenibacillus polymyxa]|uniref:Uncharacterized protein n=1 Tax=Paenibacillus polymyxa TaxID=1406 RepID=A0AAE9I8V4_PAEPO|nr:hypothetical protein [Paenibacillus polymyxa]URJ39959.1 hypothetical protein MF627_004554 [Paenibacillus polymyxa]URJ49194.1 hypothetical protein MF626_003537 [Paenibacillus polymyxa]